MVLLTVVSSLVAGVLGAGIIDVVSALDVVTLVATVLIGTGVVESCEGVTSLTAEDTSCTETIEALEARKSAKTVMVLFAAPGLVVSPAVGAPSALGSPVVDIGVAIAVITVTVSDTVLVVVLSGTNVSVVVTVTSGLTAEVETVEVAGLVLATGALAVAVVNGFGVATTSSLSVVETGDALIIDIVLLGVSVTLGLLVEGTGVSADSGALTERASGASASGGDGAVDVLSTESAVATAETSGTTLTGVSADSGATSERASGASASVGLGAVDVVATIGTANTVATIATVGGATIRGSTETPAVTTPGGSSDSSKNAESERLEHFVCSRDYDKLFKSLAFKCFC